MPSARLWHMGQLALAWIGTGLLCVVVQRAMEMGVYQAQFEGQRVTIVSGLWSASFASAVSLAFAVGAVVMLSWLTYTWFAGSRERRRMATMIGEPHRRPLM